MRIGKLKALVACTGLALGVAPLFASSAHAIDDVKARVFQTVTVPLSQSSTATSGDNTIYNDIDQSFAGADADNDAKDNQATGDTGAATADNANVASITQHAHVEAEVKGETESVGIDGDVKAKVEQEVTLPVEQSSTATSGDNTVYNTIAQNNAGADSHNDANGNTASLDTGDARAWNTNTTTVNQSASAESELEYNNAPPV